MEQRERQSILLRLQDSLMAKEGGSAPSSMALPFQVGTSVFALAFSEVLRVQLPAGMVPLARYAQLPACVVGVSSSEQEMLTVLDAGRLLGRGPVHGSMKSRLVVFGEGPMKGFGLLVSRVLELTPIDDLDKLPECQLLNSKALSESITVSTQFSTELTQ